MLSSSKGGGEGNSILAVMEVFRVKLCVDGLSSNQYVQILI